jgi:hypothetical protein
MNTLAAELEDNPTPCDAGLEGGKGYLKVFEHNEKVQLLITGLTAEDRKAAAEYLATHDLSSLTGRIKSVASGSGSKEGMVSQALKLEELKKKAEERKQNQTIEEIKEEVKEVNKTVEEPEDPIAKALKEIEEKRKARKERGPIARFFHGIWLFLRSLIW